MEMQMAIYFLIAVAALLLFGKIMSWPFKFLIKLLINAVLGIVLLVITNMLGAGFGIQIGMNAATVLIAGFFGIPGIAFLIIFKFFL